MTDEEKVDILDPQTLHKTGVVKTRIQAKEDGDWLGTFNVWVVQTKPEPAIIYQLRSPNSTWEPNKLDVSAGGHLSAGEEPVDGVREAHEELGRNYSKIDLISLGNRENDDNHTLCNIFLIEDNSPFSEYKLDPEEVTAIFRCPLSKLIEVFENESKRFIAHGISHEGKPLTYEVSQKSFPFNADNYHPRMARLIMRTLDGEKELKYNDVQ
jgi:hypothetical protein